MHWYCSKTGAPKHKTLSKNGALRATSLVDARKSGYLPSVSGILDVISKPALTEWMIDQALYSALTLPRLSDEPLDSFKVRAKADSRRQSIEAAAQGTALHKAIQRDLSGLQFDSVWGGHVNQVQRTLLACFGPCDWDPKATFACPYGFGGSLDLYRPRIVIDFKSKPTIEPDKKYAYDQVCQLAAYAIGMQNRLMDEEEIKLFFKEKVRLINIFIGIKDEKILFHEWSSEDGYRGWKMFRGALDIWKAKNNYYP